MDKLVINKNPAVDNGGCQAHIRIGCENYMAIMRICKKTNYSARAVADMLLAFALEHTEVVAIEED